MNVNAKIPGQKDIQGQKDKYRDRDILYHRMPTLPTMTTKKMKIKGKILEILRNFTFKGFFAYHEFSILDFAYQDFSGELRA